MSPARSRVLNLGTGATRLLWGYFVLVVCLAVSLASSHSVLAAPHPVTTWNVSRYCQMPPRCFLLSPHPDTHTSRCVLYTHCSHKNGTLYTTYWTFFHQPQESPYQGYLWCLICSLFLSKPLYAVYLLKQLGLLFQNRNSLIDLYEKHLHCIIPM